MYRVVFYCDDKNLGTLKRMLAQAGAKDVVDQPVVNAEVVGGKMRSRAPGVNLTERIYSDLLRSKRIDVDLNDLRRGIQAQGGSVDAVYSTARRMIDEGMLKRAGPGHYKVKPAGKGVK